MIFFLVYMLRKRKRGIVADYLPWLLIAIVILAIILIAVFIMKEKGVSLIDMIKDLFKGR